MLRILYGLALTITTCSLLALIPGRWYLELPVWAPGIGIVSAIVVLVVCPLVLIDSQRVMTLYFSVLILAQLGLWTWWYADGAARFSEPERKPELGRVCSDKFVEAVSAERWDGAAAMLARPAPAYTGAELEELLSPALEGLKTTQFHSQNIREWPGVPEYLEDRNIYHMIYSGGGLELEVRCADELEAEREVTEPAVVWFHVRSLPTVSNH